MSNLGSGRHQAQPSESLGDLELGAFDIDGLVGNIIDGDGIPPKDSDSDEAHQQPSSNNNNKSSYNQKNNNDQALASLNENDVFAAIPSKDDSDDDGGGGGYNKKKGGYQPPNIQSNASYAENVIDDIDFDNPALKTPASLNNQESVDMDNFDLEDIGNFGDDDDDHHEEHKNNDNKNNNDINNNPYNNTQDNDGEDIGGDIKDLEPGERMKIQKLLDETVMTLLQPDYFQEFNKSVRRDQLRKHTAAIKNWSATQIDRDLINVAEKMTSLELCRMYDTQFLPSMEEKELEQYSLQDCELSEIKAIPASFFEVGLNDGGLNNKSVDIGRLKSAGGGLSHMHGDGGLDYLRANTEHLVGGMGDAVGGMGKVFDNIVGVGGKQESSINCSGCGVGLKFKAKKRLKYNYMAFKCKKTSRDYVFHDYLCVKLRKIKEAIKQYVYDCEKEDHPNMDDENALINISRTIQSGQKADHNRARPVCKTTPKKGDHNYMAVDRDENRETSQSSTNRAIGYSVDYDYSDNDDDVSLDINSIHSVSKNKKKKNKKKLNYIIADGIVIPDHLDFRRYRCQVSRTLARMNELVVVRQFVGDYTYRERMGKLPEILLYCDLNEFGIAIWEFISSCLKSKMRASLWHILEFLALEMPTNSVLHLLKRHTHLLNKHDLVFYDKICKATMEGSKFPIATTLRLSAFMYERANVDLSNQMDFRAKGHQYVNVARKLLKEIESDHLFALLLMIPTDIAHQNIIEIALKYDLTYFLEEPRIVRVFAVIWYNGHDFLEPENNFNEPEQSVDILFGKLISSPGKFYFSPYGKFWVSAMLYIGYLGLFTYVTLQRIYDYTLDYTLMEMTLWGSSAGYVIFEILEFIDGPKEYFSSMTNYWDILIAINWCFLAYLRFINEKTYVYDDDGSVNETLTRNLKSTELYMVFWAMQCIILWTRLASLFKISQRAGPLIRIITNMLSDVLNFSLIWVLFFIGASFASFYVIGGDLQEISGRQLGAITSVSFYCFKTLIGQQNWDRVESYTNDDDVVIFNATRSNMVISLLVFDSIFGLILLLNLLIAMMASSYEAVKSKSLQELNKQKIDTYYDLDKSRGVIAPPFNVLAYFFYIYWFAFETLTWLLTFGRRQFNEAYFSPLNKANTQYTTGDRIKFRQRQKEVFGECLNKTPKSDRSIANINKNLGRASVAANHKNNNEDFDSDLVVEHHGVKYPLNDRDIIRVKQTLFKRRLSRWPTFVTDNAFCRYCRYNLTNDSMSISYYLSLFEKSGQHIDPDDKKYMSDLLNPITPDGIPNPVTCRLCPNCYRPYKLLMSGDDVLNRPMFVLEIVSYMVFLCTFRWVIALLLFIPASIVRLIKYIIKKSTQIVTGRKAKSGSNKSNIMKQTEENDDYRAKVRQVSKQEEKIDAIVKRIDGNVKRLELTLTGNNMDNPDDMDFEEEVHILRSDEFDDELKKIKKEINDKFNEITKLLSNNGWQE